MLKKIKEFLETSNGKIILFGLSSIIVPIAVNWVNNTFIKFKLFGEESLLNYIVLCLIWAAILVIIVLIVKFFKYLLSKRMTYSDTNKAIKEISKKYIYRSNELNKDKVVETHKREMFTFLVI